MKLNFIALKLRNNSWIDVLTGMQNNFRDIINEEYCKEKLINQPVKGKLFETDPHITLYYNSTDVEVTEEELITLISSEYRNIVSKYYQVVRIPAFQIFSNPDAKVLTLDASQSIIAFELRTLHDKIIKFIPSDTEFKDYRPHVTITYLNPDTRFALSANVIRYLQTRPEVFAFSIQSIIISDTENNYREINI